MEGSSPPIPHSCSNSSSSSNNNNNNNDKYFQPTPSNFLMQYNDEGNAAGKECWETMGKNIYQKKKVCEGVQERERETVKKNHIRIITNNSQNNINTKSSGELKYKDTEIPVLN